jgi:chromosome segregation ATPase
MIVARNIAFTTVGLVLVALTGCATTHGNLTSSADRLERNTQALSQDAREGRAADHSTTAYSRDARELADQAHDFRRTVADRRADDRDVKAAFEQLSRSYHALRDEVDRSDAREAQVDLKPVTEAYLDVEREMGGYPDSHRYARDSDTRDRY